MKIENFYTAFGYVTCAFAEMEADLRSLIAGLAFGDDAVTAATFLDSSQLNENTAILRKLARRHWDHEPAMIEIAQRIEKLRLRRNLFIHGLWSPGDFTAGGVATVRDLNSVYEKSDTSREWTRGKESSYSIAEFNALLQEVRAIEELIAALCRELEKSEDFDFSHFGSTSAGKPTRFALRADGTLGDVVPD